MIDEKSTYFLRWRIINPSLLAEYAYVLGVGGKVYIVTDVEDLFEWMTRYMMNRPLIYSS